MLICFLYCKTKSIIDQVRKIATFLDFNTLVNKFIFTTIAVLLSSDDEHNLLRFKETTIVELASHFVFSTAVT